MNPAIHASEQGAPTILLVDDDAQIRTLTSAFLERNGYCVLTCGDAACAEHLVHNAPAIDLLVTDLHMPNFFGIELGQRFKQLRPGVPILIVSGSLLNPQHVHELQVEGWNFLDKPFAMNTLLTTVQSLLANSAKPE